LASLATIGGVAVPRDFGNSLASRSATGYLSAVRQLYAFTMATGAGWPLPLTAQRIGDFLTWMVVERGHGAAGIPRLTAALSRLAIYVPGFAADHTKAERSQLAHVIGELNRGDPADPQGMDEFPNPRVLLPAMLGQLGNSAKDKQLLSRLSMLDNTGMRCTETHPSNLFLRHLHVALKPSGAVDSVRIDVVFSKSRKTMAAPIYRYLFPRTDGRDAVGPLISWLGFRYGYALRAGCVADTDEPVFPVLEGAAASSVDTAAVTSRIRSLATGTGMLTADEVSRLGSHSFRVTLTTTLYAAGVELSRIAEIMGWGGADLKEYRTVTRYVRASGIQAQWRKAFDAIRAYYAALDAV